MLPDRPGTYALILSLSRRTSISVGKLGEFTFPPGCYAYVGSARGPGGLAARVARHHRKSKTHHWHIDYLRPHTVLIDVWYTLSSKRRECEWAEALSQRPGASIPARRFGASDCRCPAHLIGFPAQPDLEGFAVSVQGNVCRALLSA